MERSAEWLRGAIEALNRAQRDFTVTVPELQAEYVALLAAAEAREAGEVSAHHAAIELRRKISECLDAAGLLPQDERQKGVVAGWESVIDLLDSLLEATPPNEVINVAQNQPTAAEVIAELHGCLDTIKHLSAEIGADSGDIAVNGVALLGLAKIARWKEANGGK